ncbi:MAG: chemotaxis protein CheW [Nitrosospira sp.]
MPRASMTDQYIVFILDTQRYALHLTVVDRVVRMVHVTPLPHAPDVVLGVVNLEGQVIPVMNVRQRFNLPVREIALTDRLIFAHTARRSVALVADTVTEVAEWSAESLIPAEEILPEVKYLEGVIKFRDGLILIHDLDKFLSLEEEHSLDLALDSA